MEKLTSLVAQQNEQTELLNQELAKVQTGNKAAITRLRKNALAIGKLSTDIRKAAQELRA